MRAGQVLGIDIGGTKLAVGIVDQSSGAVMASLRDDTPVHLGGEGVYQAAVELCRKLPGVHDIDAIGVCYGGQVYENRVLRSTQVAGWENFPLEARLKADIAHVPVRIVNDANAIAWLEWTKRTGPELNSLFYVTVSTGIGGGFVHNGQIFEGRHGLASEIGHMIIDPHGAVCVCGRHGCLEALAAGPAISLEYTAQTGLEHSARKIAQQAAEGDAAATRVLQSSGGHVGRALAAMNALLDVDMIVIGGGVSRSGHLWWSAVMERLQAHTPPWASVPEVVASTFGELEGVLAGAAATRIPLD